MDGSVTRYSVTFLHDTGKSFGIPGEDRWCLYSVYVGSHKQTINNKMIACDECNKWYHLHCIRGNEQIPQQARTQTLSGLTLASVLFLHPVLYCCTVTH